MLIQSKSKRFSIVGEAARECVPGSKHCDVFIHKKEHLCLLTCEPGLSKENITMHQYSETFVIVCLKWVTR